MEGEGNGVREEEDAGERGERDFTTIEEGQTKISVPTHEKGLGPKSSTEDVFYNPAMELNRDICISFLNAWMEGGENLLDGMAATGVRGLRMAQELDKRYGKLVINDVSSRAKELISKNIDRIGGEATATNDSIEEHVLDNRYFYDYIDVDPFGSPVEYYPTAARFVSDHGVIGVSATDTAVLCGTYPDTCFRRYSSRPKNNWCRHEIGLRVLISYCVREAARHDRGVRPLLSYYQGHHFRAYLGVRNGAKRADESLSKLRTFDFDDVGWSETSGDKKNVGPLWAGDLYSKDMMEKMESIGELEADLLELWREEQGLPPFFYDTNIVSKKLKRNPPSIKDIIRGLKGKGEKASRTHFSPTGVKTTAEVEDVMGLFKD